MKIKMYETLQKVIRKYRNSDSQNIDYQNAKTILKNDKDAILIDVRSPQEYNETHLDNSINIPLYDLEKNIENLVKNKNNTVIVYCQSGNRSKRAIEILNNKNYTNLYQIEGGLDNINF